MPAGEVFTDSERREIARVVAEAEQTSGWVFAIEIGRADGSPREYAEQLHARLPDPARSVLVQVDPERRTLEIVTGRLVRRSLDNRAAALGAVTMQSAFAAGDLCRGLMTGVQQLAQISRTPPSLHTDTP